MSGGSRVVALLSTGQGIWRESENREDMEGQEIWPKWLLPQGRWLVSKHDLPSCAYVCAQSLSHA